MRYSDVFFYTLRELSKKNKSIQEKAVWKQATENKKVFYSHCSTKDSRMQIFWCTTDLHKKVTDASVKEKKGKQNCEEKSTLKTWI